MTTDTSEHGLESIIVASLTGLPLSLVTATPEAAERQAAYGGAGYVLGDPKDYDREYCVDLAQPSAFLQATQPATAESLGLDEDKTVKVKVSFTDNDGTSETVTSGAFPSSDSVEAAATQTPDAIWSATLKVYTNRYESGCNSQDPTNRCRWSSQLTDDDFTLAGDRYVIHRIALSYTNAFHIKFEPEGNFSPAELRNLTLYVDGASFPINTGEVSVGGRIVNWENSGIPFSSWYSGKRVNLRLTAPKAGTPSAPRSLVATGAHGKVNLTWSAPAIDGGGGISDYEYRHAEGASVEEDTPWISAGKDLKETVTGLTNGAAYAFEVRAANRAGKSTAVTVTGTPIAAACSAPVLAGRQLVWTGNLQVASGRYFYGYDDTHGGSLDDSSLEFGVHSYVVDGAFVWLNGPTSDSLVLSFRRNLPSSLLEQLTFHVCDSEGFALADATRIGPYHYRWSNSGLDWSDVIERTLYLSIPEAPSTVQQTESGTQGVEAPTITDSPALSESGADGAWTAGETVDVTLTFSEAVTVDTTGGTPSVGLSLGGTEARSATYIRESGTTALVFAYTLTAADGSHTSLLVPIDSLTLNGGAIRSQATAADAALGHLGAAKTGSAPVNLRDEGDPFTASFEGLPESHDGSGAFTFELRFSEAPASGFSYSTVRNHALTVTEGSVSNVRRLEPGKNVRWEITVQPSSNADVTIAVNATTDCTVQGAICTSDGRKLSGGLEMVVPGPTSQQAVQENSAATGAPTISGTAQVGETLTALTSGISDADGLANASFTYQWLADNTEIAGATGSTYTLAAADVGKVITVTVSFTDDAGNAETLTSAATTAVVKPPLTATVHDRPSSHDGSTAFTFELRFSEAPGGASGFSYTTLQNHALTVTGGTLPKVRRLEAGKNVRWEITVQPSLNAAVTIVLPITTDCTAQGAICTSDGRKLSGRVELTISGPGG